MPGQCYVYTQSFSIGWVPMGSPMNTFRSGSSITRMGRFLVAVGGRGRSARPLNSIEVLSTRNPNRWRTLNRLTLPRPTYDNCIVAVNKTAVVMTGGVGQESQVVMLDLKDKRFFSMAPLKQPRRKHGCVKATVNGRNGVIVAGGSSDAVPALSSVEFIDLDNGDRLNLGRMRTGRRFPGVMVMANNLVIAGGERTDSRSGRTVIMDDMETLRKSK